MGNPTINEAPFSISGICRHPLILNKRRSPALATVFYRREEEHGREAEQQSLQEKNERHGRQALHIRHSF